MVTDRQVRKLRQLLAKGWSLASGARKTDMDDKTARKYRDRTSLPSETISPREWRTRSDPFAEVWPEVQARLTAEPRLRAFTLFGWLQDRFPGRFPDSQRRTFERRVRDWRGLHGPNQSVMFPQIHDPGGLAASDFTSMNSLGVTIARQPFNHLLYHLTLTYSNWEFVSVCFSESFEAVSSGLQQALWQLGGVPRRHRSDSLSAAVNNLSEDREFRGRYRDLMAYYQIEPQRTNARQPNENGDVESLNGHLKMVVEQGLLLRGSRDFASRVEYEQFLAKLIGKRNAGRADKFREEQHCLGELPPGKLDHRDRVGDIKVNSSSTIQVKRNTYSVPSRLIGMKVDVIIDADEIEVWRSGQRIQTMPRLLGDGKHAINYRHVIESLVRKPGALEHYQYHADMFPTSHFRMAYDDLLRQHSSRKAAREYLKILQLAARDSQDAVQDALRLALSENRPITAELVRVAIERHQQAPPVTEVHVELPDLNEFDSLLHHFDMEVDPYEHVKEEDQRSSTATVNYQSNCEEPPGESHEEVVSSDLGYRIDGAVAGTPPADVPRAIREPGPAGDSRVAEPHGVSSGIGGTGMPGSPREPDRTDAPSITSPVIEDLVELQLESLAITSGPAVGIAPRRIVPGSPREPAVVRQARFGKKPLSLCVGGATHWAGPLGLVHNLHLSGAATAGCQTGLEVAEADQEAVALRCLAHRRSGLCAAEPRRDGGAVHTAGRAIRTGECDANEQSAIQPLGADLQRRDDYRRGHRPVGASQRDPGVERIELSFGKREESQTERCRAG